jgi:hypothetical protein
MARARCGPVEPAHPDGSAGPHDRQTPALHLPSTTNDTNPRE